MAVHPPSVVAVHVLLCVFEQKPPYEIYYGLVGSEMGIRDRREEARKGGGRYIADWGPGARKYEGSIYCGLGAWGRLVYTSDAADDLARVGVEVCREAQKQTQITTDNEISVTIHG